MRGHILSRRGQILIGHIVVIAVQVFKSRKLGAQGIHINLITGQCFDLAAVLGTLGVALMPQRRRLSAKGLANT